MSSPHKPPASPKASHKQEEPSLLTVVLQGHYPDVASRHTVGKTLLSDVTVMEMNESCPPDFEVDFDTQVDETKVREAIRTFLVTPRGIWLHREDSFGAMIQVDNHQDHHSVLTLTTTRITTQFSRSTNEELEPIPSGAEWRYACDKTPEGIEIVDEEFSEAVVDTVRNKSFISSQVLNNLGATISEASFVLQDGFYYQTAVVTPEKFPHHLDQIAKTLDLG
jgi:hypothetical protein